MPELTGQELTRLVRQDKANTRNDIPILGVTAHVFPGEIQEFLDAGMDAVLTKPFVPSQLYERMDSILTPAENSTLDRTRLAAGETISTHVPLSIKKPPGKIPAVEMTGSYDGSPC
jgi:DNA-binding response OmpR family regulator